MKNGIYLKERQMKYLWNDGTLSEDDVAKLLKDEKLKKAFRKLPIEKQSSILHASAPEGSDTAKDLNELARYIDGWFRRKVLREASKIGLSEKDADNIAKAWIFEG